MRTIVKAILINLLCVFITGFSLAQSEETTVLPSLEIGLELQAYPTGIIPGFRIEKYLNNNSSINFRVGYQVIDHRDLGVQENEEGSGYGASFAYRRFLNENRKGLSLALRTDLWFNTIDWENQGAVGTTKIKVVQPNLMGEYAFYSGHNVSIIPSISLGWEWNVSTDGEPTGEGAIILVGCTLGFGL
ncbi:MAG: hypothetical protein P1U56_22280 [Saprospiraceae bacterium]|nr:hypothetical protein [Saprospiraceae bacterium]